MSEVKLGKPKYEQGTKNYFSFKKGQDMFILRILPPMGELADEGKWSVYHRVEFGYAGTDGKMKPFLSPRVVNYDKMVEVESFLQDGITYDLSKEEENLEREREARMRIIGQNGNTGEHYE